MPRLPFDESESPTPATDQPMSVSQLTGRLKRALTEAFPGKVRVVGEVSNFSGGRRGGAGHWFFSLKDSDATIRCVCFASVARRVPFEAGDGMAVVATGRVDLYPAQGSVQLYIDKLEPVGQGALELALRQLMEELRGLGYFDPESKRRLPGVPRRIAVVTSRGAAALQDVIHTAHKRWPGFELLLYDVRVQGEDAAPQIAAAVGLLSRQGPALGIDAIILTRGGGSIEDLWAFNERVVADAIFDCPIPVVAAIGHETDTTVAELVADLRCATPTQAAMTVVPERDVLSQQIEQLEGRLTRSLERLVERARTRLAAAQRYPLFANPERLADAARERLVATQTRLHALPKRRLQQASDRLRALTRHLDAVGPSQVLKRGYTYTTDARGHVLRSAAGAESASTIHTVFHDGKVRSTIEDGTPQAAPDPKPTPRQQRKPRARKGSDGPGLFDQ